MKQKPKAFYKETKNYWRDKLEDFEDLVIKHCSFVCHRYPFFMDILKRGGRPTIAEIEKLQLELMNKKREIISEITKEEISKEEIIDKIMEDKNEN